MRKNSIPDKKINKPIKLKKPKVQIFDDPNVNKVQYKTICFAPQSVRNGSSQLRTRLVPLENVPERK